MSCPVFRPLLRLSISSSCAPTFASPEREIRIILTLDGAPLSLPLLIQHGLVRSHRPAEQTLRATAEEPDTERVRADAVFLPDSPFPLLQQTEHPFTADIVWSVHPCQVGPAVDEILREDHLEPYTAQEEVRSVAGSGGHVSEGGLVGDEERRVKWLETWMMLSNGIVALES